MNREPTIAELNNRLVALDKAFANASHTLIRILGEQNAFHHALLALIDSHPAPESFLSNLDARFQQMDSQQQDPLHTQGREEAKAVLVKAAQEIVEALRATKS